MIKHELSQSEVRADNALARLESKMDKGFAAVDTRFAEMNGKFTLLQWMFGLIVAGLLTIVMKLFM
jgi:hypothetical protein